MWRDELSMSSSDHLTKSEPCIPDSAVWGRHYQARGRRYVGRGSLPDVVAPPRTRTHARTSLNVLNMRVATMLHAHPSIYEQLTTPRTCRCCDWIEGELLLRIFIHITPNESQNMNTGCFDRCGAAMRGKGTEMLKGLGFRV